jgi:hypothetical protein
MDVSNVVPHPKQFGKNIRFTGDIKASEFGVFYLFQYVEKEGGNWVVLKGERHMFWICQVHNDFGVICNWQIRISPSLTDN